MAIIDFNGIVEKCQKYLESKPAIILGSGFSIPYGLPSMYKLSEEIIDKLSDKYDGDATWEKFVKELNRNQNLENALQNIQLNPRMYQDIIKVTWEMINKLDAEWFIKFIEKYEDFELQGLPYLFERILQSHPRNVNVITPNYDRLVEYSADRVGAKVLTGFEGEYSKTFEKYEYLEDQQSAKKTVSLCKVHGSLDWFKTSTSNQLVSIPHSRQIVDGLEPVIVTPGINKYQETHNEPFRTLIHNADLIIDSASSYLCIGYGFNDEHLQPRLITQIQKHNKPIVIVTKSLSEKGREVIRKAEKHLVIEEESTNYTRITAKNESEVVEGNYWKLDEFVNLWLG